MRVLEMHTEKHCRRLAPVLVCPPYRDEKGLDADERRNASAIIAAAEE